MPKTLEGVARKITDILDVGTSVSAGNEEIAMNIGKIKSNMSDKIVVTSEKEYDDLLEINIGDSNSTKTKKSFNNSKEYGTVARMFIPHLNFENTSSISIYALSYMNGVFFQNDQTDVGSSVLSVTINNKKIDNLQTPIDILFKINKMQRQHKNLTCRYWNETTSKN